VITTYKVSNMRAIPNCAKPPPVGRYLSSRQLHRSASDRELDDFCCATLEMDAPSDRPMSRLTHRQRKRILRMSVFIPEASMSSPLFDGYTSNTVAFENGILTTTTEVLYSASHVDSSAPTDDGCTVGPSLPTYILEPFAAYHIPNTVLSHSPDVSGCLDLVTSPDSLLPSDQLLMSDYPRLSGQLTACPLRKGQTMCVIRHASTLDHESPP
jgi:hypothetical protein